MVALLDIAGTIKHMRAAMEVAPQNVVDDCHAVAAEIYDEYFAEHMTVGEFLCVMVYLLYKADEQLQRVNKEEAVQ